MAHVVYYKHNSEQPNKQTKYTYTNNVLLLASIIDRLRMTRRYKQEVQARGRPEG